MAKTKAFTLLNQEQIWDSDQLKIFKKYGTKAATTDLAVVLGGAVNSGQIVETSTGQAHASWWWSASETDNSLVRVVGSDGDKGWDHTDAGEASGPLRRSLQSKISRTE